MGEGGASWGLLLSIAREAKDGAISGHAAARAGRCLNRRVEEGGEKHCGLQGGGGAGRRRESSDRGALDARTLGLSLALPPSIFPPPVSLSRLHFTLLPPAHSRSPSHSPVPPLSPAPSSHSFPPQAKQHSPHPAPRNSHRLLNGPAGSSVPQRPYRK